MGSTEQMDMTAGVIALNEQDKLRKLFYSHWINQKLRSKALPATEDLIKSASDGLWLIQILEILSGSQYQGNTQVRSNKREHRALNATNALHFAQMCGVSTPSKVEADDLVDEKHDKVMELVWAIIWKYLKLPDQTDTESPATTLLRWIRNTVADCNLTIDNFTTSFHNGLCYCALLSKLYPSYVRYTELQASNGADNLELAINIAHKHLAMPKHVMPYEFVQMDENCMILYFAELYLLYRPKQQIVTAAHSVTMEIHFANKLYPSQSKLRMSQSLPKLIPWIVKSNAPSDLRLDQKESYKNKHKDWFIYRVDDFGRWLADKLVPGWMSPNALTFISICSNISLFLTLWFHYCSDEYDRGKPPGTPRCATAWHFYIWWIFNEWFMYVIDVMDGHHARRCGFQSPARHFFDHWVDVINQVLSGIITATVMPYRAPPPPFWAVLGSTTLFYSSLVHYYIVGIMPVPYVGTASLYATTIFGILMAIFGAEKWLQWFYTVVVLMILTLVILYIINNIRYTFKNTKRAPTFVVRLYVTPCVILALCFLVYYLVLSKSPYSIQVIFSLFIGVAQASMINEIQAAQLLYKTPSSVTYEALAFIVTCLYILVIQEIDYQFILIVAVATFARTSFNWAYRLTQLNDLVGFPLFWVDKEKQTQCKAMKDHTRSNRELTLELLRKEMMSLETAVK